MIVISPDAAPRHLARGARCLRLWSLRARVSRL